MTRRSVLLGAAVLALALVAAACGGDDESRSVSAGGTTSDGNDVLEIQRQLTSLGCDVGPLDGELGPDTEAGIRSFQGAASLVVDGIVGQSTRAALAAAAQSGTPRCPPTPPATAPPTAPSGESSCKESAIRTAATAGLEPGEQLVELNAFRCAGNWAVTSPTVGPNQQSSYEITQLLRWNGTAWQVVDRGAYCDAGDVPQGIYQQACQTN
ncbi:MAG TPA: peptidoglycan-binding domain-containing protein [Acidimicrobiia bacterium]|jgi:peptidoglycan hydrolase-like protein with peptidoglycan-binding domain